ncbi:MAG: N-acetyltransferase [Chloroflexota bacterium]
MDTLSIRRAQPTDATKIIDGIQLVCEEGGAFFTTQFVPTPQWEAVLYRPQTVPDHTLLVAEINGIFCGSVNILPGPKDTLFPHVANLGIFVLPSYRNRGIGHQLMKKAIACAKKTGKIEKISLEVFETNTIAIHLYKSFGFVHEGRKQRQIYWQNNYIDMLYMAYFLP